MLFSVRRKHVRGKRGAGRPVDQRLGDPGVGRGHTGRSPGFASRVPVPVVPVHPVLPGDRADHGRGGRRELRATVPHAGVLRQTDRYENHDALVRHLDTQLHFGHVAVRLPDGTQLLREKGMRKKKRNEKIFSSFFTV